MHVCMYVCMYVATYAYVHTYIYIYTVKAKGVCVHEYILTYTHACTIYLHIYICAHKEFDSETNMYLAIYIWYGYVYAYTNVYVYVDVYNRVKRISNVVQ